MSVTSTRGVDLDHACRLLGIFPLPASLLLVPDAEQVQAEILDGLMLGDSSIDLPGGWRFLTLLLRGEAESALAALAPEADLVSLYNAFVLTADPARFERMSRALDPTTGLQPLVTAVAYVHGLVDDPEDVDPEGVELDRAATVLPAPAIAVIEMVRATYRLEQGDVEAALSLLTAARDRVADVSPVFAAQLTLQRADLMRAVAPEQAAAELRVTLESSREVRLPGLIADLWLGLGLCLHELGQQRPDRLLEAVRAYQEALASGLSATSNPEAFAMVQRQLGLAYLTLPMHSHAAKLRPGIAIQAFRKALEIYRPETHPELWASTQLNLANALQYLPSSHPQENLVQAVELYEELLGYRNQAKDPLGYARLLANQANALAHLGMFPPALKKYETARKLFHWHGEPDLAAEILEQVAVIHDRRAAANESAANESAANESAANESAANEAVAEEAASSNQED